jgi:hypothetical protein
MVKDASCIGMDISPAPPRTPTSFRPELAPQSEERKKIEFWIRLADAIKTLKKECCL